MPAKIQLTVPDALAGERLDRGLATLLPDYSRTVLQRWIREGRVACNGAIVGQRQRLAAGDALALEPGRIVDAPVDQPQARPLEVIYEDQHLLVINKPAGEIVHPGAGAPDQTLLNALLHHRPALADLPRAGIVHRLDKDTSGLLVVAAREPVRLRLIEELKRHAVDRGYVALVYGQVVAGGRIEAPIGRHPVHRVRMAVRAGGRPAATHFRVEERFPAHTLLRLQLETGRTHQIRVHLAHIGYPIVGDPVYGGRARLAAGMGETARATLAAFRRQALHAASLAFSHPVGGKALSFQAPLPGDLQALLESLRADVGDG
ncbi:MAG: 23S rRNA pseudouridine(1911/1915/1917) synthase RluD [Gammaproteobacteria bacterium]|nr:23S rRNA pseudouridine(1911/1915/1917) synthase RluD [Gammaproteobacteria bacterium]